jgi:hypothetical protein
MAQLKQADVEALFTAALTPVQHDLADAQAEMQPFQGQLIQQAVAGQQQAAPAPTQFTRTPATATTAMINYKSKAVKN